MKTPFTIEQFFGIFEQYNSTFFPIQIMILVLGILSIGLLHSQGSRKHLLLGGLLGFLWLWVGIAYHLAFFASINSAAYVFGGAFILEGLFFLYETFSRKRLEFAFEKSVKDYLGYFFVLFGVIIYPVISFFLEGYPARTISLGLPCPTTIFTFGLLMLTYQKLPKYLLIIPSLWAIVGTGAAVNFGVYQDYMMIVAAVTASVFLLRRKRVH